jgi:hypothetical protein
MRANTIPTWLALAVLVLAGCQSPASRAPVPSPAVTKTPSKPERPEPKNQAEVAFESRRSHIWIEETGTVERLLRDDTKRPRHQRFVLRGAGGGTILVAHNIDLAPRVPLKKGDVVTLRGDYIWNEHRDTNGGKDSGGWIRWRDKLYR